MSYTALSTIASSIAERIKTQSQGKFKLVTYAQATNGAQIWQMIQGLANVPCAIVALGNADYGSDALKRTLRPMIFVIAPFSRGLPNDADGIWELVEQVTELFLPTATAAGLSYPEICNIDFVPTDWAPIESPETVSAYCLTLEGTEFFTQTPEPETEEN